jgi:hypothetical protein
MGDYQEAGVMTSDEFDVSITITSMDYNLSQTVIIPNGSNVDDTSTGYMTANATISVNSPLTITGLPPDAEVIVEENEPSDEWFDRYQSTTQVTLNCNNTNGHIVNYYDYAPVYSLTVSKEVTGDYDYFGVNEWDSFGVSISIDTSDVPDSDLSTINVSGFNYDINRGADLAEITGYISQSSDIVITGIPGGATYSVSEDYSSRINTDFSNSTYEASGQMNSDTNVTIRNCYTVETYSLTVSKELYGDYTDYGISASDYFDIYIELSTSAGDFSNIQIMGNYTDILNRGTRAIINASVAQYNDLVISGLPAGTRYNIREDTSSQEYTDPSQSTYSDFGVVNSDTQSTLVNTYVSDGTYRLTVNKGIQGYISDYNINNDSPFDVTIELRDYMCTGELLNVELNAVYSYDSYDSYYYDYDTGDTYDRLVIYAGVSVNTPVVVSKLVGDIQYHIYEQDTSNLNMQLSHTEDSGSMFDSTSVNLINYFKESNKLTINKIISGHYSEYGVDNNTKFKVNIRLSNGSDSFANTSITALNGYDSFTATPSSVSIVADLSVAKNIVLKGLPDSYTYTIYEVTTGDASVLKTGAVPYKYINGNYINGNSHTNMSYTGNNLVLTFKNDFPTINNRKSTWIIKKTLDGGYSDYNIDYDTHFDLIVDLTYNGTDSNVNILNNVTCNNTYTVEDLSTNDERKIRIRTWVSANSDLMINNIPFDTYMELVEQNIDRTVLDDTSITEINDDVYVSMTRNLKNIYLKSNVLRVNKVIHDEDNLLDNIVSTNYRTELYNRGKDKNDIAFPLFVIITKDKLRAGEYVELSGLEMNHGQWAGYNYAANYTFTNNYTRVYDTNSNGIAGVAFYTWYSVNEPLVIEGIPDDVHVEVVELYGDSEIYNIDILTTADKDVKYSFNVNRAFYNKIKSALKAQLFPYFNSLISDTYANIDITDGYTNSIIMDNYFQSSLHNINHGYNLDITKGIDGGYELHDVDADTEFLVHIDITGDENFDFNDVSIFGLTGVDSTSELVEGREYIIQTATNGRLNIDARISQNRGIRISGIQGLISYDIEEDIEDLALDLDNSIYEYSGRTNYHKSLLLLNNFLAFEPYALPAAGTNDMYGVMFSVAFVLLACTLGYSYSSYKRRHDSI